MANLVTAGVNRHWVEVVRVVVSLVAVYVAADDDLKIRMVWWTAKGCQRVAYRVGRLGLKAEVEFHRLCEAGRMN